MDKMTNLLISQTVPTLKMSIMSSSQYVKMFQKFQCLRMNTSGGVGCARHRSSAGRHTAIRRPCWSALRDPSARIFLRSAPQGVPRSKTVAFPNRQSVIPNAVLSQSPKLDVAGELVHVLDE